MKMIRCATRKAHLVRHHDHGHAVAGKLDHGVEHNRKAYLDQRILK
jgi:hypothetical protein